MGELEVVVEKGGVAMGVALQMRCIPFANSEVQLHTIKNKVSYISLVTT